MAVKYSNGFKRRWSKQEIEKIADERESVGVTYTGLMPIDINSDNEISYFFDCVTLEGSDTSGTITDPDEKKNIQFMNDNFTGFVIYNSKEYYFKGIFRIPGDDDGCMMFVAPDDEYNFILISAVSFSWKYISRFKELYKYDSEDFPHTVNIDESDFNFLHYKELIIQYNPSSSTISKSKLQTKVVNTALLFEDFKESTTRTSATVKINCCVTSADDTYDCMAFRDFKFTKQSDDYSNIIIEKCIMYRLGAYSVEENNAYCQPTAIYARII